jgi:DNA invertase Pin-like site-specific DNA recombinase
LQVFGALAEFDRAMIRERARAGLAAAKARGRTGGRRPSLSTQDRQIAQSLLVIPLFRLPKLRSG